MVSQNWQVSVIFNVITARSKVTGTNWKLPFTVFRYHLWLSCSLISNGLGFSATCSQKADVLKPVWSPVPSELKYKKLETPPYTYTIVETFDILHRPRRLISWAMSKEEHMGQIVSGSKGLTLAPSGLVTAFSATLSWSSEWVFD